MTMPATLCMATRRRNCSSNSRGGFPQLERANLRLLESACRDHSTGQTAADLTGQTGWDADRLDVGRIGIESDSAYLCTDAARDHRRWYSSTDVNRNWPTHAGDQQSRSARVSVALASARGPPHLHSPIAQLPTVIRRASKIPR